MTKPLVQGKLGYWTNGELVYMPQRAVSNKKKVPHHVSRNKEWKQFVRNQNRTKTFNRQQQRRLYTSSHRAFELPESIKIASKMGCTGTVLKKLVSTSQELKADTTISLPYFNIICRLIFIPDIEERSALYYAALTGHTHLVEVFLSLYLMCSVVITKSNLNASLSFKEWFDKLGTRSMCLGKKFSKAEYDVCVLNALSEDVRHVMTKKKITIEYAIDVVKQYIDPHAHNSSWKIIVDNKIQDLKKKTNQLKAFELKSTRRLNKAKKPMLVCEGLFDVDDYTIHEDEYYYSDEYEEDDEEEEEEEDAPASTTQVDSSDECFTLEHHEQQLEELEELVSYIRQNDDFSIVSNDDDNDDDTFNSSNYSLLIDNDITALTLEREAASDDKEEAASLPEDSWDIVSEVESVKSVTSSITKLSYKEILLEKASAPKENEKSMTLKDPKQITPISNHTQKLSSSTSIDNASSPSSVKCDNRTDDNDTPNIFTCEDERDGIKLARGGKQSRMFKAEGKTQREYYWAGDKSRCRRTRNMKGAKIDQISHSKYW